MVIFGPTAAETANALSGGACSKCGLIGADVQLNACRALYRGEYCYRAARVAPEHRMHLRLPRDPSDALAGCSEMDAELATLQKILAELGNNLDLAFNGEFEGDSSEEILRSRYIFALATIGNFLKATTASENLSKRFFELAIALNDLNYGRVEAFLRPSGATSASTRITWCKRAKVAVAIHAYRSCADRLTREQAAKKVAEDFPRINELAAFDRDRVNPSPPELKALNWYDEFGKPSSRLPSVARSIFELGQKLMNFPDFSWETLRPRIKEYLETIK